MSALKLYVDSALRELARRPGSGLVDAIAAWSVYLDEIEAADRLWFSWRRNAARREAKYRLLTAVHAALDGETTPSARKQQRS